jgi:hypothetical protein
LATGNFWKNKCNVIPGNALFLMLDIGSTRDYYKPIDGEKFCDMLNSETKHQWSPDGITWITPEYAVDGYHKGGSKANWPRVHIKGDDRYALSSWGHEYSSRPGGCCSTSYSDYYTQQHIEGTGWGQSFSLSYGVPLTPPPPNTAVAIFATVTVKTQANDVYWKTKCQEIPTDATFLFLDLVRCAFF